MMMPKRTKYRKKMRGRMKRSATTGNTVGFGSVALQATDCGYVSDRQIEAARRVITRTLKRGGKTWIRIFPDKPVTQRAAETRMGKGKGSVDHICPTTGSIGISAPTISPIFLHQAPAAITTNCAS